MPDKRGPDPTMITAPLPPDVFVNRELSWLEFNRRVLEEAQDPSVPLLERVKFLAIFSSALDDFFMVRVAEVKRRIRAGDLAAGPDGLSPAETLAAISEKVHRLVDAQHRCFLEELGPILASEGIRLVRPKEVTQEQERFLDEYFHRTLLPVLTPLAIDPGHPFPHLANRSLCLVVSVKPVAASVLPHATLPRISTRPPASPRSPTSSSSTRRWTCRASRISRCPRARSRPSTGAPTSGARSGAETSSRTTRTTPSTRSPAS
ncbi:MAG TPA: hypothetical protein VK878_22710 [Candidatus Deferrimicrobiaceae bacterium]|nr:hypothetical protein [Candidatus Deferrimicrobiaceae bacterium]